MSDSASDHLSLDIHLLGPFRIFLGGRLVEEHLWPRRKPKLLVKALALQPHHRLHREQLMDALWPDLDADAASNSLHKAIHAARRVLEPSLTAGARSRFIITREQQVILSAPGKLWVDARAFEQAATRALAGGDDNACRAALALYGGELFIEDRDEDWAVAKREQLKSLHHDLLAKLANLYEAGGSHDKSVACLKDLLALDRTDETAHRQLMSLYARAGSRQEAARQYRLCVKALKEELDAEPDEETQNLHRRILAGALSAGEPSRAPAGPPAYRRLTFRNGTIRSARFTPDGETVFYAAAFEGQPAEIYEVRAEGGESRPSGLRESSVLAISSAGEMALSLRRRFVRGYVNSGTLARASLAGGAITEILEQAQWADWSPGGESLAVVRDMRGRNRLEFPIGTALYETGGWVSHPRVSPRGDLVAFLDHPVAGDDGGQVSIVTRAGERTVLSAGWISAQGLAWSVAGDEVWFTATKSGAARSLYAVTLKGQERLVEQVAGTLSLYDIERSRGRALLSRDNTRLFIRGLPPGATEERDLSWLDWSIARDISPDGKTILFTEAGEGAGAAYGVYLRRTDNSPAKRLGDGSALALSPDGRWALALARAPSAHLVLLSTGEGERKALRPVGLNYQPWGGWFPDGERVFFVGNEPGRGARLYVQRINGGEPRCITPGAEGVQISSAHALSPDGRFIAATNSEQQLLLYPVAGGKPRPAPGATAGDVMARWGDDGRTMYVYQRGELPARIYRLDLANGSRELWKALIPADTTGVHEILRVMLTPDERAYVYTYTRDLSDLYLVEGLK
jgi:DNA-binding SARP family transcriptional activator/Tol biopolymer transport system component